jgi:hypothetical protein
MPIFDWRSLVTPLILNDDLLFLFSAFVVSLIDVLVSVTQVSIRCCLSLQTVRDRQMAQYYSNFLRAFFPPGSCFFVLTFSFKTTP